MRNTLLVLLALVVIAGCNKNNQNNSQPAPQTQNNPAPPPPSTLTATEGSLVAKWYYEKSESIVSGTLISQFTYTTAPSLNSIEFKAVISPATTTTNPNYKVAEKVQDGAIYSNLVWKINDVGILSMNLFGTDPKAQIDSLTATRLVYLQYTSLQPVNGTRYYLHR